MSELVVARLQSLADTTRNRILLVLEDQELTVGELCDVLRLPQSTTSRHLKILSDEGWIASRSEGASRYYRMPVGDLDPGARRLWQAVRDEAGSSPDAVRDAERLRSVLADRRSKAEAFFATAAGQWDRLRLELFGARSELLPMLGLLDPAWTVADLGCGTGHLAHLVAPFVNRVIAVDASAAMLRAARTRLGHLANVELRRGELEDLPIEAASVDVAILALVLPYMAEPGQAVAAAAKTLRAGGRLLVTDLMPHERSEYRQTLGHLWQGFSEAQVSEWMTAAGLSGLRYHRLPLGTDTKGTALFTASGTVGR
ncbi:MAG: metalloregulator ArsR/SmtB family transcription factor [Gemmatimonadota bacterium]|nr:metalloregulator ArsR/SmtB family transcription factor [Gemmatimonadota bacterium]MDH5283117.1 metalloregulator ArsR/SmtB family transcription factor [Gemmatimonadota bacterium]